MNDYRVFAKRKKRNPERILPSWMHGVLRTAGWYNITAGVLMLAFARTGLNLTGIENPGHPMPIQLVGVLVAIFGIGYLMVDRNPMENRNVLYLGMLSKFFGPMVSMAYILNGQLPVYFFFVLLACDTVYLYPFWRIYRKLESVAHDRQSVRDRKSVTLKIAQHGNPSRRKNAA